MDYIVPADVTNRLFLGFTIETQQVYCDKANQELDDLAILKGVLVADIKTPIHLKLKDFCIHYAVSQLALDNSGFNIDANSADDKYERLFKRETYVLQSIHSAITRIMFTGEEQTTDNRAVSSQNIVRG